MKMMQGEFCFACSKRSRTRLAPTPTNISTKSEPEIEKNGHARLAGDGAGEQRLAGPGRAVEKDALGNPGPEAWNFFGFSRNSLISSSSCTASSTPATSRKVIFGASTDIRLAFDLPKFITRLPPPCIWFMRKIQKPKKSTKGRIRVNSESRLELPEPWTSVLTSLSRRRLTSSLRCRAGSRWRRFRRWCA